MNLISVEIENFGSIKEKQCIKFNKGITTLIGLNESGKTTILNAINKLNGEGIKDDEKNKHPDFITKNSEICGTFILSDNDIDFIEENNPLIKLNNNNVWTLEVSIKNDKDTKYYSINCDYKYYNMDTMIKNNLLKTISEIAEKYNITDTFDFANENEKLDLIKEFKKSILPFQTSNPNFYNEILKYEKFINWLDYMPEFRIIKFSNKNILGDTIDIKNISSNLQANNFFKISNTAIDDLIANPLSLSVERKVNIERNCEVRISDKFNEVFRQNDKDLKFTIKIDEKNSKIYFFVVDSTSDNNHIPLSKRSDGFNWYFSIYLTLFEYFNNDTSVTYILLFDEPNLYLNPLAQKDLLDRVFKKEFKGSQIIYSTHSPYMIDSSDTKSIRIVKKKKETKIFNNIQEYYKENKINQNEVDLLTPIFNALQLSISNSLILENGNIPIIVEGIEDHYILNAMIKKLNYSEKMKNFRIIPCVGVDKVPLIYSYLFGLGYTIVVLLDGDTQGKRVIEKLKNDLTDLDDFTNKLFTYNVIFNNSKDVRLEDLLCDKDSKLVNHDKSLTYKTFFEQVDNYDLSQKTKENFKKLFDIIISIINV